MLRPDSYNRLIVNNITFYNTFDNVNGNYNTIKY